MHLSNDEYILLLQKYCGTTRVCLQKRHCKVGVVETKVSKEEKERKYYNQKILKGTTKDSIKNQFKKKNLFEWKSVFVTMIGVILANIITDIISAERLIYNAVALYLVKLLIWVAVILAVQFIAGVLKRIIKKEKP